MKELISLYQRRITDRLPLAAERETEFILRRLAESDTFIFPEYFAFHSGLKQSQDFLEESDRALHWLRRISSHPSAMGTLIIGGSILLLENNRVYNASPFVYEGAILGWYRKGRLFGHEKNLVTSDGKPVFVRHPKTGGIWSTLICADVLRPGIFQRLKRADYIALPTSSPYRGSEKQAARNHRDNVIYRRGAERSGAILFKCCAVHDGSGSVPRLQGRSLIASGRHIFFRSPAIDWQGIVSFRKKDGRIFVHEADLNHGKIA